MERKEEETEEGNNEEEGSGKREGENRLERREQSTGRGKGKEGVDGNVWDGGDRYRGWGRGRWGLPPIFPGDSNKKLFFFLLSV